MEDTRKVIYLVDTSDSFLMYLRILLERLNFRVIPLKKRKLLVELLRVVPCDMVILGTGDDTGDPCALLGDLEALNEGVPIPVALISQHNEEELEFDWQAAGFAGYLTRPVNIFTLFRVLHDSLVFSSAEKRVHLRSPYRERVAVTVNGETTRYRATSLSQRGLFIRTNSALPRDTPLAVEVPLGFGPPLLLDGEVLYARESLEDGAPGDLGVAIGFPSLTQEQKAQLTVCILGLLVGDILEDQEEPVLSLVSQTNVLYEEILTEHVRLAKELSTFQSQLRRTVEALPLGLVTYHLRSDGELELLSWNPAMDAMFGLSINQQEWWRQCSLDGNGSDLEQAIRDVARKGGTVRFDHTRGTGRSGAMIADITAFQPAPELVTVIVADVTEKRRREEGEFRRQKLEALGTLAGGIAHDLNNLLQTVRGGVELARLFQSSPNRADDPELDRRVTVMFDQALGALDRAAKLSRRLLTFASGGLPVVRPVDLAPIIREATELGLHGSNVSARSTFPPDLPSVAGDPEQLHQVFLNLVINAKEAMPGGGDVTISCTRSTIGPDHGHVEPGEFIVIEVADHGIGVPSAIVDRVFDPYFTTKQAGSGLGLANTFSIVRNHGGWIDVAATSEHGTTFRVLLPATDQVPEPVAGPSPDDLWHGQGRVAVMDDEKTMWPVVQGMLTVLGLRSECMADGRDLLEAYAAARDAGAPFDVVLMDLTVPGGMGGIEATAKLLEVDPQARVVVCSGYSNDPALAEFERYGFAASLVKPYSIGELAATLRSVMEGGRQDR